MSSSPYTPPTSAQRGGLDYEYLEDSQGYGLVTFAGVMLLVVATLNILWGIAAIDKANVFTQHARYIFGGLNTFGWLVLALGILQAFAGFAIFRGTSWARWFGVACACGNAILQTMWIPAYPILAMTILALDITVIYGLLAYGGRHAAARAARERAGS